MELKGNLGINPEAEIVVHHVAGQLVYPLITGRVVCVGGVAGGEVGTWYITNKHMFCLKLQLNFTTKLIPYSSKKQFSDPSSFLPIQKAIEYRFITD